jgi:hypothetical protein
MKRRSALPIVGSLTAAIIVLACGSSSRNEAPADVTGSCRAIASACHRYDKGDGVAHDCHSLGHESTDDALCAKRKAECVAACPPVEAGSVEPGSDSGTNDASSDATADGDAEVDPCPGYCECLTSTCGAQAGYPHATQADCLTACKALTAEQRECWPKFCAEAKAGVSTTHNCEHAWGKFGLDECENF